MRARKISNRTDFLFGKYLRIWGFRARAEIHRTQFVKPIPVKAYGRVPSVASQHGLYHDEDYNLHTKVPRSMFSKHRRLVKPLVITKSKIRSELLGCDLRELKMTLSAMEEVENCGGSLDEYILRTPPQELRSTLGEHLRNLMYYYMANPEAKKYQLPPKLMIDPRNQKDPLYARHMRLLRIARFNKALRRARKRFSPYYLPSDNNLFAIERQPFVQDAPPLQPLQLWWRESKEIELGFRRRLGEAVSAERPLLKLDGSNPEEFTLGRSRGGGGRHGVSRFVKPRVRDRILSQRPTRSNNSCWLDTRPRGYARVA